MATGLQIKIKPQAYFSDHGVSIPGFVWKEKPFKFNPISFVPTSEKLVDKIFDAAKQQRSLDLFRQDHASSLVYGVASEPNDGQALYFAAYLVQMFLEDAPPGATVEWRSVYGSWASFNRLGNEAVGENAPDLLVLTNLTPQSTPYKLEQARDLLVAHPDIPRIVVVAGEDPVTFFSTRLHYKMTHLFFASSKLVKRKIEVISATLTLGAGLLASWLHAAQGLVA